MDVKLTSFYPNGVPKSLKRIPDVVLPGYIESSEKEIHETHGRLAVSWKTGVTRPLHYRKEQLINLRQGIIENFPIIVEAIIRDFKSPGEAEFEVHLVLQEIADVLENVDEWAKPVIAKKSLAMSLDRTEIHYEPYGVLLNIGPWNFPFNLSLTAVVGAIAAGNCCVIKPSEMAPNTAAMVQYIVNKYMDRDCFGVLLGAKDLTTKILEQHWDFIIYTGGGAVGRVVMEAAAKHLTPVCLELGGKTPAIVDDLTCDLRVTARRLAWGKLFNCGQVCIGVDYVICHPRIKDKLVQMITEEMLKFGGENPKENPNYTRIINRKNVERLANLLPNAESPPSHGSIVFGGDHDAIAHYMQPTIVTGVDPYSSPLMAEEIFGPIMPIIEMESIDTAIEYIRSRNKPLSMYVFSEDSCLINKLSTSISSGALCINDYIVNYLSESGIGGYHGRHSFETFSHKKAVYQANYSKVTDKLVASRYPPMNMEAVIPAFFPNVHYPLVPNARLIQRTINHSVATAKAVIGLVQGVLGLVWSP